MKSYDCQRVGKIFVDASLAISMLVLCVSVAPVLVARAQAPTVQYNAPIGPNNAGAPQGNVPNSEDINSSSFRLTVCDGPPPPKNGSWTPPTNLGHTYVPCDFNAIMAQVQHLINLAIIVGVLAAILGFCYIGFLYITGTPGNIQKAHSIFPKIFWGFIIMLTAWFIVYQILSWLTGNSGFAALLK